MNRKHYLAIFGIGNMVILVLLREPLIYYYIHFLSLSATFEAGLGNYTASFTTHEGRFDISLYQLTRIIQLPQSIRPKAVVVNLGGEFFSAAEEIFVTRVIAMQVEIDRFPNDPGPILKLSRRNGWILSIDDERNYDDSTFEQATRFSLTDKSASFAPKTCNFGDCLMGSHGYLLKDVGQSWISSYKRAKWGREDDQYVECMARKTGLFPHIYFFPIYTNPYFFSELTSSRTIGLTSRSESVKTYYRNISYTLCRLGDCP